jgi:predicted methyltransferase
MTGKKDFPGYPPLFFVRMTEGFRAFLLRLHRRFTHPNVAMWQMTHQLWITAGIGVVAELGIADLLRDGPLTVDELASRTETDRESLYRLMRMLATQGIFRESGYGMFRTTRLGRALQDDQIRHLVIMHLNPKHFEIFGSLMDTVRSGRPVPGDKSGRALFDRIGKHPEKSGRLHRAMNNASRMQASTILKAYSFKPYHRIVDLGGGQGIFLAAILRHTKGPAGVVYDLPAAVEGSGKVIQENNLEGRLEARTGDFFESVPEEGDLYMMKSVLHDWNDKEALEILRNVHRAMKLHARFLVIESIVEPGNRPSPGKMTDMLMMAAAGGKERTRDEYRELMEAAGFRIRKIYPTVSPHSIIEAVKK